jgi:hypothetical protein
MSKMSGTVLILAGVALGAYTLSQNDGAVQGDKTAAAAQSGASVETPAPLPQPDEGATAVAQAPAAVPELAKAALQLEEADVAADVAEAPPPASASQPGPAPKAPAPQAVVAAVAPRVPVGKAADGPGLDRPALTREIQRQLKRIGCYRGAVSGVWSDAVQDAMKTFTDRVNATLPVDRPDPVLLAMVQTQKPGICSASCPPGQERSAGRCLPSAVVAGANKGRTAAKTKKSATPDVVVESDAVAPPPTEGRMSLSGPPRSAATRQLDTPVPAPRWKAPVRQARPAAPRRAARTRARQRAAGRTYYGYTGMPSWLPFW